MPYVVGQLLHFTWDGVQIGQAWTVTAAERDGSTISISPTFTDLGDGRYRGVFTPSAAGVHSWRVASNRGLWETFERDVVTAAQADPAAALSGVTVTSQNPVAAVGARLTLRNGDDYNAVLGNAPTWDYTGPTDLTGATVTLTITSRTVAVSAACDVTNAGQATQTITAELTGVQTATLLQSEVTSYEVAALIGAATATLFTGKVTVQPDPTP